MEPHWSDGGTLSEAEADGSRLQRRCYQLLVTLRPGGGREAGGEKSERGGGERERGRGREEGRDTVEG